MSWFTSSDGKAEKSSSNRTLITAAVCFGPWRISVHPLTWPLMFRFLFPSISMTACYTQQWGAKCCCFCRSKDFVWLHYKFDFISAAGAARNKPEPEIVLNILPNWGFVQFRMFECFVLFFFFIFISVLTFWPFSRQQFPADWSCSIRFDRFSPISTRLFPHWVQKIISLFDFSVCTARCSTPQSARRESGPDLSGCSRFKTFRFAHQVFIHVFLWQISQAEPEITTFDSFASLDLLCTAKVLSPPLVFIKIWN